MSRIFHLPDLGEGLPDAEIHEWFVQEGEEVKLDQPLVAMETAKAVVDVPSPWAGKIVKCYGKVGQVIAVGSPLVEYADENTGSARQDAGTVVGSIESHELILEENASGIELSSKNRLSSEVKATPAVRSLAKMLGVDLSQLSRTLGGKPITAEAVKKAAESPSLPHHDEENPSQLLTGTRRFMAQNLAKIHQETVPVTLIEDADIHHWDGKDTTVRIIRAIVSACQTVPSMNAHYENDPPKLMLQSSINLGLAVDTPKGLFVPVIPNVAALSDHELRNAINQLKEKARDNAFSPKDLKDVTIALSNFGSIAGRYANPMLVPPSITIVGVGQSRLLPLALNEKEIAIHRILPISLTFDHRAATGGDAARFLRALIAQLQQ